MSVPGPRAVVSTGTDTGRVRCPSCSAPMEAEGCGVTGMERWRCDPCRRTRFFPSGSSGRERRDVNHGAGQRVIPWV